MFYQQTPWGYPMMSAQQRLAQMEQQYPQLAQQPYTAPSVTTPQPTAPQASPVMGYLKGRVVTSIDEAKGAMIDLDGTPSFFTDLANGKIYVKYVTLNGTAALDTYSIQAPEVKSDDRNNPAKAEGAVFMPDEIFETLQEIISDVKDIKDVLNKRGEGNASVSKSDEKHAKQSRSSDE